LEGGGVPDRALGPPGEAGTPDIAGPARRGPGLAWEDRHGSTRRNIVLARPRAYLF